MRYEYYDKKINKKTTGKYDLTPLFYDPEVFKNLITDVSKLSKDFQYNKIAGIESMGFILASALAIKNNKSLILVRKGGKIPVYPKYKITEKFIDYSKNEKSLEISKNSMNNKDKVLIIDDWIETGEQVRATIKLIEKTGTKVAGIISIHAEKTEKNIDLFKKYKIAALKISNKIR